MSVILQPPAPNDLIHQVVIDVARATGVDGRPVMDFLPARIGDCKTFAANNIVALRKWGIKAERMQIYGVYDPVGAPSMAHTINHVVVVIDGHRVVDQLHDTEMADLKRVAWTNWIPLPECTAAVLAGKSGADCLVNKRQLL